MDIGFNVKHNSGLPGYIFVIKMLLGHRMSYVVPLN